MNYEKIYEAIIQKARSENRIKLKKNQNNYVYYERHHILPRCLHGTNDKENLVLLTAREHYVCHKLLTHIYKGNRKLICALHKMTYGNTNKCIKTSRDYEYVVQLMRNTPLSKETKEKISANSAWKNSITYESMKNARIKNSYKYKTIEFRKKISILTAGKNNGMFGKHHSKESIQKIKNNLDVKGEKNPMFNHVYTTNTKQKMSISQKNRTKIYYPICKKFIDPGNYSRWHKNKHIYIKLETHVNKDIIKSNLIIKNVNTPVLIKNNASHFNENLLKIKR